ncbi:phosphotransferase family protein [Nocardioides bizhenqiangii]|uniref:Phosphotransferase family protein n=1 Tax=Nocardioides bizhenqiangii TaxID=3095076 RepID=A0ABZ0ZVU5_9ACTN|nr:MULTISPECIES: phosphotransferase family protein [unclassified Nocardioides]MDZ5622381.1 phosphotransferase family protein [Nocardioides sp. HM23]WQQ28450.1 phosphotransferase family protein [Nocardioides sp. HM61]
MTTPSRHELALVARALSGAGVEVAGPLEAEPISGGRSNLTSVISDGRSRWILRTPPRAGRTASAHDVAREHRVTAALADSGVPVPPALLLCEDESLLGVPFTVSGHVEGAAIRTQADLAEHDDQAVVAMTSDLLSTLAALHRVDHVAAGLEDFGRPEGYAARQLNRWSRQWDSVGLSDLDSLARAVMARLAARVPPQRATSVVHGDFRIDNTLIAVDGPSSRVAAVIDWELSTIGDPVADVAMMCAYRHPPFDLVMGAPSAWTSDRLPSSRELAAGYEAAGGVPLEDWGFHLSLACFKVAVIAAGIDHRRRAGAGAGPGFDTAGEAVAPYLELALRDLG